MYNFVFKRTHTNIKKKIRDIIQKKDWKKIYQNANGDNLEVGL